MRRTFMLTSLCIAALSVAWSATSAAAAALPIHATFPPPSEHAPSIAHVGPGPRVVSTTVGSLPAQLGAFTGGGELAAIAAAGASGNSAVTTPADPSITAGPSNVVEAVNSALFVYARTGGTPVAYSINTMINNVSSGWVVRYPHVVYDPMSGRFLMIVLEFNVTSCGSQLVMMESQANPALPWTARGTLNIDPQIPPPPSGTWVLGDLSMALTGTLVVASSDYQPCNGGSLGAFVASQTYEIQRADLMGGTMTVNSVAFQAGGPIGVQPVMGLGLTAVAYEIANDANCSASQASTVAVFTISGTPDAHDASIGCSGTTSSFSESFGSSTPPAAPQGGTSITLQTHDDRFLSAVWENNVLWASGNTGCATGACLNVVRATASAAAPGLVSGGTQLTPEGVSGTSLYYPALAVDSAGDVMVTFDESTSSTPESMMLASITGGGTWSSGFATLATSANFYGPGACTSCSWGDYSGAVQDALHPTDVWVVSEYTHGDIGTGCPTANSCWNTYVARYTFAGPAVSSLTPPSGTGGGGQSVIVSGSDFAGGTTATFGGSPIAISNVTPDSFTFTTPPGPAAGGFEHIVATDSLGSSSATSTASAYLYIPLSNYNAMTPFRILDTRSNRSALGPGVTRILQVTGVGLTPVPSTAVAVVLNVTAVDGTASSLLSLYPTGTPQPSTSSLNFRAGTVTPNLVTVTLGTGGAVSILNALGTVDVLADVEGYFAPPVSSTPAGEFHPMTPSRVCDTRSTSPTPACKAHGAVIGGTPMVVTVTGAAIPTGTAAAVVLNLTGVAGSATTFLSIFPTTSSGTCAYSGTHFPPISNLNILAGAVQANRVMVALGNGPAGADSAICVFAAMGTINVVLDANGWFGTASAPDGYQYQPIAPSRICDTRTGAGGCAAGALGTAPRPIHVTGFGGVPGLGAGNPVVQAVIANLTGIAPTQGTYLVLYPANLVSHPLASDINLSPGQVLPNLVVVQLDTTAGANDGVMDLFNAAGSVNAAIDIEGWFQ
ncbi:MAG: IPT/TIG domain-containing protein [Candidatus Dormibacteria bacterium]